MRNIIMYFAIGNSSTAAGYWGDYKCDVPHQTLVNLMEHLAVTKDQVNLESHTHTHTHTHTRTHQLYIYMHYIRTHTFMLE